MIRILQTRVDEGTKQLSEVCFTSSEGSCGLRAPLGVAFSASECFRHAGSSGTKTDLPDTTVVRLRMHPRTTATLDQREKAYCFVSVGVNNIRPNPSGVFDDG